MPQIMLPVLQACQGFGLGLLVTPNANRHMGMAAIRRDVYMVDFDRKQSRIGHFEANEFDKLFPHCFRDSPDSPFVHKKRISDVRFRMSDCLWTPPISRTGYKSSEI